MEPFCMRNSALFRVKFSKPIFVIHPHQHRMCLENYHFKDNIKSIHPVSSPYTSKYEVYFCTIRHFDRFQLVNSKSIQHRSAEQPPTFSTNLMKATIPAPSTHANQAWTDRFFYFLFLMQLPTYLTALVCED